MKSQRTGIIVACVAAMCTIVQLRGDPPQARDDAQSLTKMALDGTLGLVSRQKLADLRHKAAQDRAAAYGKLAEGLEAALDLRLAAAKTALTQASDVPEVKEFANARLPLKIDEVVKQCKSSAPAVSKICDFCGSTGMADCSRCAGRGLIPCPHCRGSGLEGDSEVSGSLMTCRRCRGTGCADCPYCEGSGTVKCPRCEGKSQPPAPREKPQPVFTAPQEGAVRQAILLARRLSLGATDIYTADGAKPSPLAGPEAAPAGR